MFRFSVLAFALTACSGGATETDLETSFCTLIANGPYDDLAATPSTAGAPSSTLDDRAAEVDLSNGSYIAFTPDEPGSYVFGLSEDVGFEVRDGDDQPLSMVDEVTGSACGDLAVRSTWTLSTATYFLYFDTDAASVVVVAEESDDDL